MVSVSWMLMLLLSVVSALETTGGEVTTTMVHQSCTTVFIAKSKTDTFEESCEPITFPCSGGFYAVPDNCDLYFRCVHQSVLRCSSPTDTGFNIETKTFTHTFYANCSCPNGGAKSKTASTRDTTTTVLTPASQSETGGIVGGVIALVVVVIVVIIIVVVLRRRNKARLSREDKSDVCRVETAHDNSVVCRVNSVQSDTYDELKEIDPTYDNATPVANKSNLSTLNRGPLPQVPDVDVTADDTYLRLTREFPAGDAENTTLADGERNDVKANDSVYLKPVTADSGDAHDTGGSTNNEQP